MRELVRTLALCQPSLAPPVKPHRECADALTKPGASYMMNCPDQGARALCCSTRGVKAPVLQLLSSISIRFFRCAYRSIARYLHHGVRRSNTRLTEAKSGSSCCAPVFLAPWRCLQHLSRGDVLVVSINVQSIVAPILRPEAGLGVDI